MDSVACFTDHQERKKTPHSAYSAKRTTYHRGDQVANDMKCRSLDINVHLLLVNAI